ncbi:hypothetical protein AMECASPLE_029271, partial [Ameca splendens]
AKCMEPGKCQQVKEFDDESGSVLRIQPLRAHHDEAIYECTAANSAGEISACGKLVVLEDVLSGLQRGALGNREEVGSAFT